MYLNGPFVLCGVFPGFKVCFASKLDLLPLKRSVLELKGLFWGSERTNGEKQPKWLQNKGKSQKITTGLITGIGLQLAKHDYKTEGVKRQQKHKRFHFHAATVAPLTLQTLFFFVFRIPLFFCAFFDPAFSKDSRGSAKRKTLAFFRAFPAFPRESKGNP